MNERTSLHSRRSGASLKCMDYQKKELKSKEKNLSLPAAPFLQIFILPFYMNMSQNYIRNFKFQTTQTHNKEHVTK